MREHATAQPTIVSFLLDCTGSMEAIKSETIGGFNAYIDALEREAGDLVTFTLLEFDSHSIDTLCTGAKLSEVARLTPETYQPRAYTPLIDACVSLALATRPVASTRNVTSCTGSSSARKPYMR